MNKITVFFKRIFGKTPPVPLPAVEPWKHVRSVASKVPNDSIPIMSGNVSRHRYHAGQLVISRYLDGLLHCSCGPAVTWSGGTKAWYTNGELNKVEYEDGSVTTWKSLNPYLTVKARTFRDTLLSRLRENRQQERYLTGSKVEA